MSQPVLTLALAQGELDAAILHFGNASDDCQRADLCVLTQERVADLCALLSLVYGGPMTPPKTVYDLYNARKCLEQVHYDLLISVYGSYMYLQHPRQLLTPGDRALIKGWADLLSDDLKKAMDPDVKQRVSRIQSALYRVQVPPIPPSPKLSKIKPIDIRGLPPHTGTSMLLELRKLQDTRYPVDTPVLFYHTQFQTLSYLFARYGPKKYEKRIEDIPTLRQAIQKADKVADALFRAYIFLYNPEIPGMGPSYRTQNTSLDESIKGFVHELYRLATAASGDGDYADRVSIELMNIHHALAGGSDAIKLEELVQNVRVGKARDYISTLSTFGYPYDARACYVFKAIAAQFIPDFDGNSVFFFPLVFSLDDEKLAIVYDAFAVFLIAEQPVLSRKAARWALPYLTAARKEAATIRKRNMTKLQGHVHEPKARVIAELLSAFKTAETDLEYAIGRLMDRENDDRKNILPDRNRWGHPE